MAVQIRIRDIGSGEFSYRKKEGNFFSGELTKAEIKRVKALPPSKRRINTIFTLPSGPNKAEAYGNIRSGISVNINMSETDRARLYDKSVEMFHAGVEAGIPMDEIKKDIEKFIDPAAKSPATGFSTINKSDNWRSINPATMAEQWAKQAGEGFTPEKFQPRSSDVMTGAFKDLTLNPQTKSWFFRHGADFPIVPNP